MLAVASWPLLKSLEARLGGRRGLGGHGDDARHVAVAGRTARLAIDTIADHAEQVTDAAKTGGGVRIAPSAAMGGQAALVGDKVAASWGQLADAGPGPLLPGSSPT